jgi:hypothetical protein
VVFSQNFFNVVCAWKHGSTTKTTFRLPRVKLFDKPWQLHLNRPTDHSPENETKTTGKDNRSATTETLGTTVHQRGQGVMGVVMPHKMPEDKEISTAAATLLKIQRALRRLIGRQTSSRLRGRIDLEAH